MTQDTLFPLPETDEPSPISLVAQAPTPNFLRDRYGKPRKVALRSPQRKGRIVATVYSGEADAAFIVRAVNEYYERHRR